jgi:hypothetical protein
VIEVPTSDTIQHLDAVTGAEGTVIEAAAHLYSRFSFGIRSA